MLDLAPAKNVRYSASTSSVVTILSAAIERLMFSARLFAASSIIDICQGSPVKRVSKNSVQVFVLGTP
jgi:hypothetical protein